MCEGAAVAFPRSHPPQLAILDFSLPITFNYQEATTSKVTVNGNP